MGHTKTYNYYLMVDVTSITETYGSGSGGSGGALTATETIEYDDDYGVPTEITDFKGNTTTFSLDSHGNVLEEMQPGGVDQEWSYNSAGQILTHTDADGNTTTYVYDPDLAGPWFIGGDLGTQIQQDGYNLTFINENNQSSPGYFLSANQVVATAWGNLVGTLVPTADGMRIAWANGTAWDQLQLAGQGVTGDQGVQVDQDGNDLTFINENGGTSPGYVQDLVHVVATGWGDLVGTVVATFQGFEIDWANGSVWAMPRLGGNWYGAGRCTQVVQVGDGTALTFVNESGATSAGYVEDSTHVVATGWGDLVGTLVESSTGGDQIDWSNGSVWVQDPLGRPSDSNGDLETILEPGTPTPTIAYTDNGAGNVQTVTDATGDPTIATYDNADRLMTTQDPVQAAAGQEAVNTYDGDGNLLATTDADGHTTHDSYNARDELVSAIDPLNQIMTYGRAGQRDRSTESNHYIYIMPTATRRP